MGLFSGTRPQEANLAEVFPPGTPFRLVELTSLEPEGERLRATIVASPVTVPSAEQSFGVWGSLAQQLTELEPGELPAIVTMSNGTGQWRFEPHGPSPEQVPDPETGEPVEQPMRVAPAVHMLPDAPADRPNPIPDTPPPTPPPVPEGGHRNPAPGDQQPTVHPTPIDESQVWQPGEGAAPASEN